MNIKNLFRAISATIEHKRVDMPMFFVKLKNTGFEVHLFRRNGSILDDLIILSSMWDSIEDEDKRELAKLLAGEGLVKDFGLLMKWMSEDIDIPPEQLLFTLSINKR